MAYEAYISIEDYIGTYKGQTISDDDFARIALRASDELDKLTFNRVRRAGLVSYDADVQEAIKLATCALAEALALIDAATEGTGVVTTSESVSGYSYSIDKTSINQLMADGIARAKKFLKETKLTVSVMSV